MLINGFIGLLSMNVDTVLAAIMFSIFVTLAVANISERT